MASRNFTRLVRFADASGKIWFGEADGNDLTNNGLVGQSVTVYRGENPWDADFAKTADVQEIAQVYV